MTFPAIHFAHNERVAGYRHLVHHLRDPAEFAVAVSGATLAADFLARQELPAVIEQFQAPGWALDFHQAQVKARIRGPLGPDWASLGLMRVGTESSFHGFAADQGVLICNPPGEGIDGQIAPGFTCASINVPRKLWEQCRLLAGVERTNFGSVAAHRLEAKTYAEIDGRLRAVQASLRAAAPGAARAAEDFTRDLATLAWRLSAAPEPSRDSVRNRARLARRAEAWMREHFAGAAPVTDVCLALRVSRRELEYAFRANFDTSPRDFLQALRLNAVRRALQGSAGGQGSVSRLALDHGITHLGRFAAHYRTLFGESPSETRCQRSLRPAA